MFAGGKFSCGVAQRLKDKKPGTLIVRKTPKEINIQSKLNRFQWSWKYAAVT